MHDHFDIRLSNMAFDYEAESVGFEEEPEELLADDFDVQFAQQFGVDFTAGDDQVAEVCELPVISSGSPSASSSSNKFSSPVRTPGPRSSASSPSTSPAASALTVTPPEPRRCLDGYRKRRLNGKTKLSSSASCKDPFAVDGHTLNQHPAYHAYVRSSASNRCLVRKRVLQTKYRIVCQFKNTGNVIIGDNEPIIAVDGDANMQQAVDTLDDQFFWRLARDTSKHEHDRGYALWWLASKHKLMAESCGPSTSELRVQGVPSVLLTYQHPSFVVEPETLLHPAVLGGSGDPSATDQFQKPGLSKLLERLKQHQTVMQLKAGLEEFAVRTCNSIHSSKYAFSVELCTKTWAEQNIVRVHGHLWVQLKMRSLKLADAAVCGSTPFVNWCGLSYMAGSSSRSAAASMAGAFYCSVEKVSTIVSHSTASPWVDYPVKDSWITSLYSAGKISASVAKQGYYRSCSRAQFNVTQLEFVESGRRQAALELSWAANEKLLRSGQKPWKQIDKVKVWLEQYEHIKSRYLFLVLDGPSSTGKTRFALDLFGIGEVLYSDCSMGIPNLRQYDSEKHRCILFDELGPKCAMTLKKCLQAGNDMVTLGSSPTMSHSYELHVWRVCMIICCNTWRAELRQLPHVDVEWLNTNSVLVEVAEPLWQDA